MYSLGETLHFLSLVFPLQLHLSLLPLLGTATKHEPSIDLRVVEHFHTL